MNSSLSHSALGKTSEYVDDYAPELLYPVSREIQRAQIGIQEKALPFVGHDHWNAYELSWLSAKGKPEIALLQFDIPASSPYLIESKSLKLYLNSFNQTRFDSLSMLLETITQDLSRISQSQVEVQLNSLASAVPSLTSRFEAQSLDDLDVTCCDYQPNPTLLRTDPLIAEEKLCSDLLKSNCLVTGQPDWGSLYIHYQGPRILPESLLQYIVSLRQHNEFHEHCVERIFMDLKNHCHSTALCVMACYTRRGGLDINPARATHASLIPAYRRLIRQ